jgi:hypothetical protein
MKIRARRKALYLNEYIAWHDGGKPPAFHPRKFVPGEFALEELVSPFGVAPAAQGRFSPAAKTVKPWRSKAGRAAGERMKFRNAAASGLLDSLVSAIG